MAMENKLYLGRGKKKIDFHEICYFIIIVYFVVLRAANFKSDSML